MSRSIDIRQSNEADLKVCTTHRRCSAGLKACLLLAIVVAGCSKPESKPAPTYTLRNVTLPDLSHAVPSVQQQLKDGYAALQARINGAATPPEDLAAAYGQMGMLLMAAEYRGEAESAVAVLPWSSLPAERRCGELVRVVQPRARAAAGRRGHAGVGGGGRSRRRQARCREAALREGAVAAAAIRGCGVRPRASGAREAGLFERGRAPRESAE